jgi:hypothetical protein
MVDLGAGLLPPSGSFTTMVSPTSPADKGKRLRGSFGPKAAIGEQLEKQLRGKRENSAKSEEGFGPKGTTGLGLEVTQVLSPQGKEAKGED